MSVFSLDLLRKFCVNFPSYTNTWAVYETYSLVVVLEGNICISPLECVVGSVIPRNVINPVGFIVVPKMEKERVAAQVLHVM